MSQESCSYSYAQWISWDQKIKTVKKNSGQEWEFERQWESLQVQEHEKCHCEVHLFLATASSDTKVYVKQNQGTLLFAYLSIQ